MQKVTLRLDHLLAVSSGGAGGDGGGPRELTPGEQVEALQLTQTLDAMMAIWRRSSSPKHSIQLNQTQPQETILEDSVLRPTSPVFGMPPNVNSASAAGGRVARRGNTMTRYSMGSGKSPIDN